MHVESLNYGTLFLEVALAVLFILVALRVLRELSRPSIEVSAKEASESQRLKAKQREYSKSMV